MWQLLTKEEAKQYELAGRIKWFRWFLLRIYKLEGIQLSTSYMRPSSRIVVFWAHCISVRFDTKRLRRLEHFLGQFKAAYLSGRDIFEMGL